MTVRQGQAPKHDGGALVPTEFEFIAFPKSTISKDPHGIAYDIGNVQQTTRYKQYEACVPSGVDVTYCICDFEIHKVNN